MPTRRDLRRRLIRRLPSRRLQPLFERMYGWSLNGMGIGTAVRRIPHSGEEHLICAIARTTDPRGAVCLDVGANEGDYSRALAEHLPGASIHAFEPVERTCEELRETLAGTGVTVHGVALGAQRGSADMHVIEGHSQLASLHPLLSHPSRPESSVEVVEVTTLDEWAAANDIPRIALLKIDVEGAELEVLRGASRMIRDGAIDMVQFEFGTRNSVAGSMMRDFFEILPGYRMHRVVVDGLAPMRKYNNTMELPISATNYLAVRDGVTVPD